ncbi:hypothetical protein SAMN05421858_1155 [Haladaptatus litoreus]|uniref:Major facilitator superfamily (MFS) profile domain-containing protein n=1 Tax=Haladaptatus litoreus TaxID=553468 RepID=A0A1N6XJ35_9EURY|nr:hypothetical protein [Haladaptatus litoreus]SIR02378.1 hypothetical protein SAMN05421858_1155 [Haladaptatus litoreus]
MSRFAGNPLAELRANATYRLLAVGAGIVIGLALAWVHWLGLLVGGALVSLPTKSWKRGVLAGLGFGVLSLLVFLSLLAFYGSLAPALGMGQITALVVAIPLAAGTIGGLVRMLV